MRFLLPALATCALSLSPLMGADHVIPKTMAMPEGDAFAVAVMPDFLATLGRIEAISELFNPGMLKPGDLKNQLGMMLGDMGLENLVNKPLIIVVGPGAPTPSFALIIPAKNPQTYLDAGVNFGMLLGKAVGELAILTQTPDGEILGEKIAAAYPQLIANLPKDDFRIAVAPDKLMTTYGPMITMMAPMLAMQSGDPASGKMLGLQIAGMITALSDVQSLQIDIGLDPKGIITDSVTMIAKDGSGLAKALAAPAPIVGQRASARLNDSPALMSMSGRLNSSAWYKYAAELLKGLKDKPEADGVITNEFITTMENWGAGLGSDFAFAMRSKENVPLQWEGIYAATDSAKAEKSILAMVKQMSGDAGIGKMYQDMGVTMKLAEKARTSPSGVAVHKLSADIDPAKMQPEQAEQMKLMSSYEIAATKGWVVMAQDSAQLDALIAGTGKGLATKAEKSMGANRHLYGDIDFLAFIKAAMKMSGTGMDGMIPEVKNAEPMGMAFTSAQGKALFEMRIPLQPFAEMTKAMKNQRGGGRRGGPNNQAPPPDQTPAF
jgi:hypothetical protein